MNITNITYLKWDSDFFGFKVGVLYGKQISFQELTGYVE